VSLPLRETRQHPLTSSPGWAAHRGAAGHPGVRSASGLPFLLPRAWQDRRHPLPFAALSPGRTATVRGQVLSLGERRTRTRGTLEAVVSDGRSILVLKWFRHNRWLRDRLSKEFPPGTEVLATGRVDLFAGRLEMHHPDLAPASEDEEGEGILPIYPLTAGLTRRRCGRRCGGAGPGILPGRRRPPPRGAGGSPTSPRP